LVICVSAVLAALAIERESNERNIQTAEPRATAPIVPQTSEVVLFSEQHSLALPGRPIYPYSVIPGGVLSSEELRNAVFNDPSVAFHYADFKVSRTQVLTLGQDRRVYVSYRIGAEIFWTRKTLSLHKGETVITDGIHEARTRCGNRISAIAEAPVFFAGTPDRSV
jgi:hypothetical protein